PNGFINPLYNYIPTGVTMKKIISLVLLCTLAGCVQKAPLPPEVSGELVPVNTQAIMDEVKNVG
ncbi:hypothetical protein Q2346_22765, partial [Escherichia coli]|nr:hypothetical protein [Escherichia coli]